MSTHFHAWYSHASSIVLASIESFTYQYTASSTRTRHAPRPRVPVRNVKADDGLT